MKTQTILFLCTGNSCRSQMAEGFARALLPKDWQIYSAGVRADGMNQYAIKAMAEVGIDISKQWSKTINELKSIEPDIVITLCDNAQESCPTYKARTLRKHWGLQDPASATGTEEEILAVYRTVRDKIRKRLIDFLRKTQND